MSDYTDIQPELDDLKNAVYGEEVRDSMISAIKKVHDIAGSNSDGTPVTVRQALLHILQSNAYAAQDCASDVAVIESWANDIQITGISLSASSITINGEGTRTLTATTTPSGGAVSWTSSNPSIATVNQSGVVTSVGNGSCTITATSGSVSASCQVTVTGLASYSFDTRGLYNCTQATSYSDEGSTSVTLGVNWSAAAYIPINESSRKTVNFTITIGESTLSRFLYIGCVLESSKGTYVSSVNAYNMNGGTFYNVANLKDFYYEGSGNTQSFAGNVYKGSISVPAGCSIAIFGIRQTSDPDADFDVSRCTFRGAA